VSVWHDIQGEGPAVVLRMWFAGPRRSLDDMDPALRELVGEMQRQAFRQQKGHDDVRMLRLDPPASERLGDVNVPALVLTGDDDVADIHQIAIVSPPEFPVRSARRSPAPRISRASTAPKSSTRSP
jgi:pimeloyl-ACP methyl ester carboxylesterase